jgi:hypothetical protein
MAFFKISAIVEIRGEQERDDARHKNQTQKHNVR